MKTLFSCVLALSATMLSAAEKSPPTADECMGFEAQGAWLTAPADLLTIMPEAKLWSTSDRGGKDWKITGQSFAQLAGGATVSTEHVKQGKYSLLWKDHERFPTVACALIKGDWSGHGALELSIYSERPTGETVTLAALSDDAGTPWKDFFVHPFVVDWSGWKTIHLRFSSFTPLNSPAGWSKIDGVYFFTKMAGHQPNPCTVLYLDDLKLVSDTSSAPAAPAEPFIYRIVHTDEATPLNHEFPEMAPERVNTPITHQPYFRAERALYKYYPRFNPGYVSFDLAGKPYISIGDRIETLSDQGKWVSFSLKETLIGWAKKEGWVGLRNRWGWQGTNPMIRFDHDGGIYVLASMTALNAKEEEVSPKLRTSLLLYSADKMKTWQCCKLPGRLAEFEHMDGHNADANLRPPVILLSDYNYFEWGDPAGYLLIPQKNADGTLTIPEPVKFADACIPVNFHSGDANTVLTHGDKLYIVYGWYLPKHLADDAQWKARRPAIPGDHPALRLHYTYTWGSEKRIGESKNGVPTFVRSYDLKTRQFSEPVFVGMGGGFIDDHNWPAMTVDSKGILHVLINGHHNPSMYTHSKKSWDIAEWSEPEYLTINTSEPNISYNTFNCDRNDNLYFVARSTRGVYNNHLGLYRKKTGADWEPERTLVTPFKYMYNVWYHRMSYDITRNRLFLTYYSQGGTIWLSRDQYEFFIFTWPDKEKNMYANFGKPNSRTDPGPLSPGAMYRPGGGEITMLVSDDSGESWHLATSEDFPVDRVSAR